MRVAVSYDMRNPPQWRRPWPEHYRAHLDHACAIEQLGFDRIWISSHHFSTDGYGPSFASFAGAISAVTSVIRVGSRIRVLPLEHPLLVAEELAVVDNLLNGRLDVGIGAGYRVEEFAALGVSRSERFSRLDEGIEILRKAWGERQVSHEGKHFRFEEIDVEPKPVQGSSLPLWVAGRTVGAARRAGRHGCHFLPATVDPEVFGAYRTGLEDAGFDPSAFQIAVPFWATTTLDAADAVWDRIRPYAEYRWGFYETAMHKARDPALKVSRAKEAGSARANELIGSPDEILEAIHNAWEAADKMWNEAVLIYSPPAGLPIESGLGSYKLFAQEVLPTLRQW